MRIIYNHPKACPHDALGLTYDQKRITPNLIYVELPGNYNLMKKSSKDDIGKTFDVEFEKDF